MAGIQDCWTAAKGCTATLGNFGLFVFFLFNNKLNSSFYFLAKATYAAMSMTYSYLTPDLWKETVYTKTPFQEYSAHLANTNKKFTVGVGDKNYQ
jgi:small subunit ribosomal protein S2e